MTIDLVPHLPRLRRYALSLDPDLADDLVQSTCYHALRYQDQYDPALSKESTWLGRIMRFQFFNWKTLRRLSGTGGRRHAERIIEVELPREGYDELPMSQPPALQSQPEGPARVLADQVAAWIERKRSLTPGERQALLAEINDVDDVTTMSCRDGYPRSRYNMLYTARRKLRNAMDL